MKLYRSFIKRLLDIVVSVLVLLLSLVVTIPVTLCLLIANNGTSFFFQMRPGKYEKLFKIIKFKTMNDKKDRWGNLLPDELRLTTIGKIVRKLSIDELPQLINVLKGDMSLIGPRPLLVEYLSFYTIEEKKRHEIRPGITGLSQISGRNNLCWNDRLALDVYYVENCNLKLDLYILFKTIVNVIKRKDVVVVPSHKYKPLNIERK
ncbi:sugar transferase [uncultured Acetobacteroides sp.]|uniref:sugar transferase n=1 Tax=uncultured Acetobacteroides sp. TaxID=1760811 RepID=UPI0029F50483|nr:sugar transferase [uncultured Acetobacteroides sp.]